MAKKKRKATASENLDAERKVNELLGIEDIASVFKQVLVYLEQGYCVEPFANESDQTVGFECWNEIDKHKVITWTTRQLVHDHFPLVPPIIRKLFLSPEGRYAIKSILDNNENPLDLCGEPESFVISQSEEDFQFDDT